MCWKGSHTWIWTVKRSFISIIVFHIIRVSIFIWTVLQGELLSSLLPPVDVEKTQRASENADHDVPIVYFVGLEVSTFSWAHVEVFEI